eukprot:GDKI01011253.1.p2 GENE.GDKI01011253.1~~GDKI01011253.1.p2  ORF type:complete len:217 (-),score=53.64 GDKI01011253.1:49-699(-)
MHTPPVSDRNGSMPSEVCVWVLGPEAPRFNAFPCELRLPPTHTIGDVKHVYVERKGDGSVAKEDLRVMPEQSRPTTTSVVWLSDTTTLQECVQYIPQGGDGVLTVRIVKPPTEGPITLRVKTSAGPAAVNIVCPNGASTTPRELMSRYCEHTHTTPPACDTEWQVCVKEPVPHDRPLELYSIQSGDTVCILGMGGVGGILVCFLYCVRVEMHVCVC